MKILVHDPVSPPPPDDRLEYARQVVRAEAAVLQRVAERLDGAFLQAVELIYRCTGRIAITGTGKSADVGRKMAGTFNSMGTRSYELDATRALHGDLGMVHPQDVVLVLSHSGDSEEIVRLLGPVRQLSAGMIGLTGNPKGTLAQRSDVAIIYGPLEEVCPLGLAPSSSTTAMIALGDALAFVLSQMREFTREDFARFHPAGSLGRKLLQVDEVMRRGRDLRLASADHSTREVFSQASHRGRRTGAVMVTDVQGRLRGIFTDSDLARLFEQRREGALDRSIAEVMTPQPLTVAAGTRVLEAVEIMRRHKISELPVVDVLGKPVGLLDITDLIAFIPAEEDQQPVAQVA